MTHPAPRDRLRRLPRVDAVLGRAPAQALVARHGRPVVVEAVRTAIDELRAAVHGGEDPGAAALDARVAVLAERLARPTLCRVVNATGVVLHTNLGRAPLAPEALDAQRAVSEGWSNLEYDVDGGCRGDRHGHTVGLLRDLTGAEAGLVVNNNASAVLLCLATLADGGEVVVSRGELIEIGDAFRIPDVCRQGGVRLVEVGTTNRTHRRDYEQAVGPQTRAILKVHRSNFAMTGFVADVGVPELAQIAGQAGLPLLWDLGSGCLVDLAPIGLPGEPTVRQAVAAGPDLVTFSGDKLLGGPQAGVICGRAALVSRLRRHPLMRAVRPDRATLAGLEATLRLYRDRDPLQAIPVLRMLGATVAELASRAEALAAALARVAPALHPCVVETTGRVGGGALPEAAPPSTAVRLDPAAAGGGDALHASLRWAPVPIVGRQEGGGVLLDLRTLADADFDDIAAACVLALGGAADPP